MTTITALSAACRALNGTNFELNVYGIFAAGSRNGNSMVRFKVELCNRHIQHLLNLGVRFDFSTKKVSDKRNGNDWIMDATASVETFAELEMFCRDNHLNRISMLNDHQLLLAGFPLKNMRMSNESRIERITFSNVNPLLKAHTQRIAEIRRRVRVRLMRMAIRTDAYKHLHNCYVAK